MAASLSPPPVVLAVDEDKSDFIRRHFSEAVPPEESLEFRKYIGRDRSETCSSCHYEPADKECVPSESTSGNGSYASFGDDGTTASVSMSGEIIQISKYLGLGDSGIFTVDPRELAEPYLVTWRAQELEEMAQGSTHGYGLRMQETAELRPAKLEFLHARWPRLTYKMSDMDITVQLLIHNGTVIQQYTMENRRDEDLDVVFDTGILLREQNYTSDYHEFNESDYSSTKSIYHRNHGPYDYGFVIAHELDDPPTVGRMARRDETSSLRISAGSGQLANPISEGGEQITELASASHETEDPPEAICVVMTLFVDGVMTKFVFGSGNEKSLHKQLVPKHSKSELIAAFKLFTAYSKPMGWQSLMIPATDIDIKRILAPYEHSATHALCPFSQDKELNFVVQRNLEHILSVCSIPIRESMTSNGVGRTAKPGTEPCIALTCGDIAGHRISISGRDTFAFKFLLSILDYLGGLQHDEDEWPGEKVLRERIGKVCKGHLQWVFRTAKTSKGCFDSNYWVTGNIIAKTEYLPTNGPANTAFQILKAGAFGYQVHDEAELARDMLQDTVRDWVKTFKPISRRSFGWRHSPDSSIPTFRLDDHVWIWKALKSVETLWHSQELKNRLWKGTDQLPKGYNPAELPRQILQRFTTENEISKKKMLAVTRSASDNRFLFHSRDTVLFYALKWGFFDETDSTHDVWQNTIEAQQDQEHNQDWLWNNPLRYALAVMVGKCGYTIDRKRSPTETVTFAKNALFRSLQSNGLFPGQIDETTKVAQVFENEIDRDFYFHTGFEIPYILWESERATSIIGVRSPTGQASASQHTNEIQVEPQLPVQPKHQPIVGSRNSVHGSPQDRAPAPLSLSTPVTDAPGGPSYRITTLRKPQVGEYLVMKKHMPFNKLIDSRSIVEISEEWLYSQPDFLDFTPALQEELQEELQEVPRDSKRDKIKKRILDISESNEYGKVIEEVAGGYVKRDKETRSRSSSLSDGDPFRFDGRRETVFLVDIPKSKRIGKGKDRTKHREEIYTNLSLWEHLSQPRIADKAKKRFIWSSIASRETALILFLASPESEKESISLFFDRHANYDKYFWDDATAVSNTWNTEIHVSFYQLLTTAELEELETCSEGEIGLIPKLSEGILPDLDDTKVVRACMGFRFVGDFFDRYWTCHFLEYNTTSSSLSDPSSRYENPPYTGKPEDGHWPQRKVLELILFGRILEEIQASTKTILEKVKTLAGVKPSSLSFSPLNSDDYFSFSKDCQHALQILDPLEEDFKSTFDIFTSWENRESDRVQVKPRWTNNDERKYGRTLIKLLGSNKRALRELKSHQATIQSLRTSIRNKQDFLRNEITLRNSENVRIFTYVTVVFLPLGFAASIFSMAELPSRSLVTSMAICAVVALSMTVVALANAQKLIKHSRRGSRKLDDRARHKMTESFIMKWHLKDKGSKDMHEKAGPAKKIDKSWLLWFWIVYFMLEVPARQISDGCANLPWLSLDRFLADRNDQANQQEVPSDSKDSTTQAKPSEDSHEGKGGSTAAKGGNVSILIRARRIFVALLCLPIYLFSYSIQLLCLNVKDIWSLFQREPRDPEPGINNAQPKPVKSSDALVTILTNPGHGRPFKRTKRDRPNERSQHPFQDIVNKFPWNPWRRQNPDILPTTMSTTSSSSKRVTSPTLTA